MRFLITREILGTQWHLFNCLQFSRGKGCLTWHSLKRYLSSCCFSKYPLSQTKLKFLFFFSECKQQCGLGATFYYENHEDYFRSEPWKCIYPDLAMDHCVQCWGGLRCGHLETRHKWLHMLATSAYKNLCQAYNSDFSLSMQLLLEKGWRVQKSVPWLLLLSPGGPQYRI